jgi:plasmid segregation protein ParM
MTNLTVAVDDGYAQTKIFGRSPDSDGTSKHVFRTSVRSGRHSLASLDGEGSVNLYRTGDEEFTVSDKIVSENTQFDGFHLSSMNRALVHHGLAEAGYGDRDVDLWAGLPVKNFFSNGSADAAKIEAKKRNLLQEVVRSGGGEGILARIASVNIGCQAVAAFIDWSVDENLQPRHEPVYDEDGNEETETIAVVDIGGRTTDIAVVVGGTSIDFEKSGTADLGVLDVYKSLQDKINAKFQVAETYALGRLDSAVRGRRMKIFGKAEDVGELVDAAVAEVAAKIGREVERKLGTAASIDAVIFVGGGAALFAGISSMFRNGHVPEDPEFANARGMWKLGMMHAARRAKKAAQATAKAA